MNGKPRYESPKPKSSKGKQIFWAVVIVVVILAVTVWLMAHGRL